MPDVPPFIHLYACPNIIGWGMYEGERKYGSLNEVTCKSLIADDIRKYALGLEELRLARYTISIHSPTTGERQVNPNPVTWNVVIAMSSKHGKQFEGRGEDLPSLIEAGLAQLL